MFNFIAKKLYGRIASMHPTIYGHDVDPFYVSCFARPHIMIIESENQRTPSIIYDLPSSNTIRIGADIGTYVRIVNASCR